MNTENQMEVEQTEEINQDTEQEIRYDDPDPLLQILVAFASQAGTGPDVTLSVGGSLISGILIGRSQYLDKTLERIKKTPSGKEAGEAFADAINTMWGSVFDEDAPLDPFRYGFLHLKNATVIEADGSVTRGMLWRGRLTSIDGFTLGSPSQEGEPLLSD